MASPRGVRKLCFQAVASARAFPTRRFCATPSASTTSSGDESAHGQSGTAPKAVSRSIPADGLQLSDFSSEGSTTDRVALRTTGKEAAFPGGDRLSWPVWDSLDGDDAVKTTIGAKYQRGTFYLETYGCQMNVSDSEVVRAILLKESFKEVEKLEEADFVLTNTCAIREKAEGKIWERIKDLASVRRKRQQAASTAAKRGLSPPPGPPDLKVGILGCMAERLKEKLLEGGGVDLVTGPDAYRDLPRLLDMVGATSSGERAGAVNVQLSQDETYADIAPVRRLGNEGVAVSAFISIMRGCNNMCTYCIVPFTRGRERSRPLKSIVDEAKRLYDTGVREVVLLGQNVNSYHDKSSVSAESFPESAYITSRGFSNTFRSRGGAGAYFADLLTEVAAAVPEARIRFTSPHPKDFPDEVLQAIADFPNICRQLHLPAQSGSSVVLDRMGRGYTREAYLDLVQHVRKKIPGVTLSSDFISGFCGETEEDHRETVSLIEQVEFDQAFLFAYSLREKTRAARRLQDDVPPEVKNKRLQEVITAFRHTVQEKNTREEIGRDQLVLVEGPSRRWTKEVPELTGRTDGNKRVTFLEERVMDGLHPAGRHPDSNVMVPLRPGDFAVVHVEAATSSTLRGRGVARTTIAEHTLRGIPPGVFDTYSASRQKVSL